MYKFNFAVLRHDIYAHLALVAILWVAAMGALLGATLAIQSSLTSAQDTKVLGGITKPGLKASPLPDSEYHWIIVRFTPLYPDVTFKQEKGGIQVTVAKMDDYDAWIGALSSILASSPGTRWSSDKLCAGKCEGGTPYSATLKGSRIGLGG